jgi:hypothetical protein
MTGNAGNRQDNRQRGNAAQLLEKYKTLARDAQLAGDRVQTEYYLQYADHYFRVLEENRSRYEEQQAQRRPRRDDDDYDADGDEEMGAEADSGEDEGEVETRQRQGRDRGRDRGDRAERGERGGRERYERRDRQQSNANGAPRGEEQEDERENEERIALGVLPPAIGAAEEAVEEEAPKPRRRATRKPRATEGGDEDIAPAA